MKNWIVEQIYLVELEEIEVNIKDIEIISAVAGKDSRRIELGKGI